MDRDSQAASRFECSVRERCIFETGIKLATIYHQYVGTPFNHDSVSSLETAMADSIGVQPYVSHVEISIDRSVLPPKGDHYSYVSLTGDMIDAIVEVTIDGITVRSEMRYDEDLRYPLMYVSKIED